MMAHSLGGLLMRAAPLVFSASLFVSTSALAQTPGQPAAPQYQPTTPGPIPREAPARYRYTPPGEPFVPVRAPKFALWTGARVSFIGFGFDFYRNANSENETTGNLVGNGVAPEFDVGVRIAHRFIPYVFFEHGFLAAGHRFDGDDAASASTDTYGVGLRFLSGNVDHVSFCTDISVGRRVVSVRNGSGTYSISGIEILRLGLGAEMRLSSNVTLSPMLGVAAGTLNDSSGSISWANRGDGITAPPYENGARVDSSRPYVILTAGLGAHFDLGGVR